ncbi:DUF2637 domain-containing protein [Nocardia nova]|uniref:DUF2637 domain-containing protein n=1 Tax=Nocardia nova TaxID=37330 RepID=UPI0037888F26
MSTGTLSPAVAPASPGVAAPVAGVARVSGEATKRRFDVAEVVALLMMAAISIAAFAWSAIALHGLAMMAGITDKLAWGGPVIVDGPIVQAAFALVALKRREQLGVPIPAATRGFFWTELGLAELVSLVGNGLHAAESDGRVLPAIIAAAVAGAAPIAGLAATHGLTALLEVQRPDTEPGTAAAHGTTEPVATGGDSTVATGETEATAGDSEATPGDTGVSPSPEPPPMDRDTRIRELHAAGLSTRQIGAEVGLHHGTVAKIVARTKTSDTADDEDGDDPGRGEEVALTLIS